jgi:hypothetical protein
MFGSVHLPERRVRAGVLICSPFQSEFLANYRREVRLAGALAARGLAVGRFHYRGTGHSDGEGRDVTFATMREDAVEAATWLRNRSGVKDLGFFGTRWGALIAAAVAAEAAGAPVALWDPTIDGERYFEEVFRFRRMSQLSLGRAGPRRHLLDEIEEAGYADVFGFTIDRAIVESSRGRELAVELRSTPRPLLLVQVDPENYLKDEYENLVGTWNQAGFSVDVRLLPGQEAWWFPGTQWQESALERSEIMVAATADWFSERLAAAIPR